MIGLTLLEKILIDGGILTKEQWEESLSLQRQSGKRVDRILIERGYVSERDLLRNIASLLGVPFLDETPDDLPETSVIGPFSKDFLSQSRCLPLRRENGFVTVATSDP